MIRTVFSNRHLSVSVLVYKTVAGMRRAVRRQLVSHQQSIKIGTTTLGLTLNIDDKVIVLFGEDQLTHNIVTHEFVHATLMLPYILKWAAGRKLFPRRSHHSNSLEEECAIVTGELVGCFWDWWESVEETRRRQ